MRLETMLLQREQVELLRMARTRLTTGLPLETRDSVILPGRRWVFGQTAPDSMAASLRLEPLPSWLGKISDTQSWVLPPDGSKEWIFNREHRVAGRIDLRRD